MRESRRLRSASTSLERRSARTTARTVAAAGLALFAAAGTFRYGQAWTYLALQLVSMTATNAYLLRHDRALLDRRLTIVEEGETERVQRVFLALLRPLVLVMLVVAGLDRRFGWSAVPLPAVLAGCFGFAAGTGIIFLVFRANSFASSVIEVGATQTVVRTGPYALVRHPMYSGMLVGAAATPLALGSYWAELLFPPLLAIIVMRLLAEERFLTCALPGYAEYLRERPKRLVPGVW